MDGRQVTRKGGRATPRADSRPDAVLVVAAQAGDERAFGVLVGGHVRAALAVAGAVVGDADQAEDVCQEALLRIWGHLDECREPERFAIWLTVAVRRHALNALRRRKDTSELSVDLVSAGPQPDRLAESADEAEVLGAAVQRLSPEQRQAGLLFDLEGWSHAEIAAALGTSEAMSRQQLMLGRRRLRELLDPKEHDG